MKHIRSHPWTVAYLMVCVLLLMLSARVFGL